MYDWVKAGLETGRKKWADPSPPVFPPSSSYSATALNSSISNSSTTTPSTPGRVEEELPYSFIVAELAHAKQQLQQLYNVVRI